MNKYLLFLPILLLALLSSCEIGGVGGGEPAAPSLKVETPTNITETGFQVNWTLNTSYGFNSIAVAISEDEDMSQVSKFLETQNTFAQSLQVEGLKGAKTYYYTISLLDNGIIIFTSEIKMVETSMKIESIQLLTEDAVNLSGKLAYLESLSGSRPGIILMHEFGVWVNPWLGSKLFRELVAEGYICFTFFFRGHGTSDPVDDIMDLLDNRDLLTKDLKAALDYMNEHEKVTSGRLGLVGGSMGATMALAGNGYEEVLSSVALSPASDGVFLIFPDMTLSSVYFLAGELDVHTDPPADFPAYAQQLYDQSVEPRKLDIIPGTPDHGSDLLSRDSLITSVRDWILEWNPL
jgi:dienelactone hydrolase